MLRKYCRHYKYITKSMCHLKALIYKLLIVLQNKNPELVDCVIFSDLTHFDAIKGGYRENSHNAKTAHTAPHPVKRCI